MTTYQATTVLDNNSATDADLRSYFQSWYAAFETGPMEQTADTGQINTSTMTWAGLSTSPSTPSYQIHKLNDELFDDAPIYIKTGWYVGSSMLRFSIGTGTGTDGAGNLTGFGFPLTQAGSPSTGVNVTVDVIGSGGEGYASVFTDPGGNNSSYPHIANFSVGVFRTTDENDQPDARGILLTYYYTSSSGGVGSANASMRYVALDYQSMTYGTLGSHGYWQYGGTTGSVNPSLRKDVSRVVIPFSTFTWVCPYLIGTYREEHSYGSPFVANPSGNPHQYQQVKGARYAGVNTDGSYSTLAVIWE